MDHTVTLNFVLQVNIKKCVGDIVKEVCDSFCKFEIIFFFCTSALNSFCIHMHLDVSSFPIFDLIVVFTLCTLHVYVQQG